MDAKDLMLGDWVNFLIDITGGETEYDPQNAEYQPMQIVSISAWANNDGEVESKEGVICDIEQLNPIPITPEILDRNGFKFEQQGSLEVAILKMKNRHPITLEYIGWSDGRWSIHEHRLVVKYVHELQHALRLCGVRKEIEI